jgi:hypothetical protein
MMSSDKDNIKEFIGWTDTKGKISFICSLLFIISLAIFIIMYPIIIGITLGLGIPTTSLSFIVPSVVAVSFQIISIVSLILSFVFTKYKTENKPVERL